MLQELPVVMDRNATMTQKVSALAQLDKQRKAREQELLAKDYGAELASVLDKKLDPKEQQKAITGLVKKYTSAGLSGQAAMKLTSDFMTYVHNQKVEERLAATDQEKTQKRQEEARTKDAIKQLTLSAPDKRNQLPGSFRALGIGSPTGKPSEAPDVAAKKGSIDEWKEAVRKNPDIPFKDKETFIKEITGQDPAFQRQLLLKTAGNGSGSERKYADKINELKFKAYEAAKAGKADEVDMMLIHGELDPFLAKASQAVMANPAAMGMTSEAVSKKIVGIAKLLRDQSMSSRGVITIKDKGNLGTIKSMLGAGQ
jgi:hypothetical protein